MQSLPPLKDSTATSGIDLSRIATLAQSANRQLFGGVLMMRSTVFIWTMLTLVVMLAAPAKANSERDVRASFEQFVSAQNAHDLSALERLLVDGPQFSWVTRGIVIKGRAAAIERFRELYRGTWQLKVTGNTDTFVIDKRTIEIIAPATFNIGQPGIVPTQTSYLLAQVWRRDGKEWRVVSILPIPQPRS